MFLTSLQGSLTVSNFNVYETSILKKAFKITSYLYLVGLVCLANISCPKKGNSHQAIYDFHNSADAEQIINIKSKFLTFHLEPALLHCYVHVSASDTCEDICVLCA